jgi:Tol biopolymer transport system component
MSLRFVFPSHARALACVFLVISSSVTAAERISIATGGGQANSQSRYPAISANGRYVTFVSDATNLVAGDTNGFPDVFVRDRVLGTTTRLSMKAGGSQSDAASFAATLSGDGTRVVFSSYSALLPSAGYLNCYLLDRAAGTLRILDLKPNGAAGTFGCDDPSIDVAGTRIAYTSRDELTQNDTNGRPDVFVRDLVAGTQRRVSGAPGDTDANNGASDARISGDGTRVLFASLASNLVAGDTNGVIDLFLATIGNPSATQRVNIAPAGVQANDTTDYDGALNANGSLLAFSSNATSLPDWGEFAESTLYLRIPGSDATIALSIPEGTLPREGFNAEPDFDYSGRWLVFASTDRLYAGAELGGVYVIDLVRGVIDQISVGGNTGNVHQPRISADGTGVVWYSYSTTQVPNDTNGTWDVFYAANPLWEETPIFADDFEG